MGPIYMNEVMCRGDETSLWDCPHKSITAEDCKHMEDASVICNIPYMGFEKSVRHIHDDSTAKVNYNVFGEKKCLESAFIQHLTINMLNQNCL